MQNKTLLPLLGKTAQEVDDEMPVDFLPAGGWLGTYTIGDAVFALRLSTVQSTGVSSFNWMGYECIDPIGPEFFEIPKDLGGVEAQILQQLGENKPEGLNRDLVNRIWALFGVQDSPGQTKEVHEDLGGLLRKCLSEAMGLKATGSRTTLPYAKAIESQLLDAIDLAQTQEQDALRYQTIINMSNRQMLRLHNTRPDLREAFVDTLIAQQEETEQGEQQRDRPSGG